MNSTSVSNLRKSTLALALAVACTAAFSQASAADAPADQAYVAPKTMNPYSPRYRHEYRHGVVPTRRGMLMMKRWNAAHGIMATGAETLAYGGGTAGIGVNDGASQVYLVFYGTQWGTSSTDTNGNLKFTGDTAGAAGAAQQMFKGIGTNGELWSADLTQWCDGTGVATGATTCPATGASYIPYQQNVLAGVWYDNTQASPAGATAVQLAQEANNAAAHFGNTTAALNRHALYIIMSPHGTDPDAYQDPNTGYCAWHDYTADAGAATPYGELAFSNQPYNIDVGSTCGEGYVNSPGTTDGYTIALGREWHDMMSDMDAPGGWTNQQSGNYQGDEDGDECAWIAPGTTGGAADITFSTGAFAEQANWSNDTNACAISHPIVNQGSGGTPTANFTDAVSGLAVTFSNASTDSGGTIGTYAWTFGDGSTSSAASPSHTYAAAGTYSVTLTVTDSVSGKTSAKTGSVTVASTGGTPTANFSFVSNGLTTTFTDSSTDSGGTISTHAWTFGDGSTSTATSPSHTYAAVGTYSVTETVTDSVSGKTSAKTLSVTVAAAGGTPTANFTDATSGLTATFTNASTDSGGTIGTYAWTFGDGSTSSTASPSHTYAAAGTYSATLTVTDSVSGKTSAKTGSVTVASAGGTPTANWTDTTSGLTATFTDSSTDAGGTIGTHAWTFGDGSTSASASPSHTYAAAGTYSVTETVTDSVSGKTSAKTASVTVAAAGGTPTANFTDTTSGLLANFTDTSTDAGGTIGTHAWTFGDGATSAIANPSHTYAAAGTYSVTETVTDSVGSKTSAKTASVTVSSGIPTQLLGNTGFETGKATPWTMSSGVLCSNSTCSGEVAHAGTWFAWLDGMGTTHTDTVSQQVAIPAGMTSATLKFYMHIDTAETSTTTAYDKLTVGVYNTAGTLLKTLNTYSNLNANSGYSLHSLTMTSYIGQTVVIKFIGTEDHELQTSFVLDDITLTVQ